MNFFFVKPIKPNYMIPKIFDIAGGGVVINHHCLTIPELKAVHDKYENPLPAFNFLYYYLDPASPYFNLDEDSKEDIIINDFPGEYNLEDEEMINAINKIRLLYMTPTYRYYLDNKILLDKLGTFARNASITTGRDGNLSALGMQIKSVGKTIMEFKQLEKMVVQELTELKGKARGDKKLAYDQDV